MVCGSFRMLCFHAFNEGDLTYACLTETWLSENTPDEVVNIQGYITHRNNHDGRLGGGVAILISDAIPHTLWPQLRDAGFETL